MLTGKIPKRFYDALKALHRPQPSSPPSSVLTGKRSSQISPLKILERWAEHFNAFLNHPSFINEEAIQHFRQVLINQDLDAPSTLKET